MGLEEADIVAAVSDGAAILAVIGKDFITWLPSEFGWIFFIIELGTQDIIF